MWVAAPTIVRGATLAPDGRTLATADGPLPVTPVPKIPLNRSYWDASTIAWFGAPGRRITVRGVAVGNSMVVRTAWPDDFTLGGIAPPSAPETTNTEAAGAESAGAEGRTLNRPRRHHPDAGRAARSATRRRCAR